MDTLRAIAAWTAYFMVWAVGIAVLSALFSFGMKNGLWWGLLGFGIFFLVMDYIYRLMGYKRGIRDVP